MNRFLVVLLALLFSCALKEKKLRVSTFAGSGLMGKDNGKRMESSFANPMGIATDKDGVVYIADSQNNLIRKIDPGGTTSTFAGSGEVGSQDGKGSEATFFYPTALAIDNQGNVFVVDTHNNQIRKIDTAGNVSTLVKNSKIRFDNPAGIAVDNEGNIFVSDFSNRIFKIDREQIVTILAGTGNRGAINGAGSEATFYAPSGLAFDAEGNLIVCDTRNNLVRKITKEGTVTTLAGLVKKGKATGSIDSASFFQPHGITIDKKGNIYIADTGNHLIRKINLQMKVTILAGNSERGSLNEDVENSSFWRPMGVAVDSSGAIYVADYQNNVIRKISYQQ